MKKLIMLALLMALALPTICVASTVVLQWTPVIDSNLQGYKCYYSLVNVQPFTGTGATQGVSPTIIPKGTTTCTLGGLDPTKSYYMAVTAYNTANMESIYSNIVTLPIFPVTMTGVTGVGGNKQIAITWPTLVNTTSYNLYWSTTTGVTPQNGTKVNVIAPPYTLNGLNDGTLYYLVVTGANGIAEGKPSQELTIQTLTVPTYPLDLKVNSLTIGP